MPSRRAPVPASAGCRGGGGAERSPPPRLCLGRSPPQTSTATGNEINVNFLVVSHPRRRCARMLRLCTPYPHLRRRPRSGGRDALRAAIGGAQQHTLPLTAAGARSSRSPTRPRMTSSRRRTSRCAPHAPRHPHARHAMPCVAWSAQARGCSVSAPSGPCCWRWPRVLPRVRKPLGPL